MPKGAEEALVLFQEIPDRAGISGMSVRNAE